MRITRRVLLFISVIGLSLALGFGSVDANRSTQASARVYLPSVFGLPRPTPVPPSGPAPWPMQQHDANRSGWSAAVGPQSASLAWVSTAETKYMHYSAGQPAVGSDGTIYVYIFNTGLYAFAPDGTPQWNLPTEASYYDAPAIGPNGLIYVPISSGTGDGIEAVDSAGDVQWSLVLPGNGQRVAVSAALTVESDGTILFPAVLLASGAGSGTGALYAIHPDGILAWSQMLPGSVNGVAIGADGTIYVESQGDGLHAMTSAGAPKWTYPAQFLADTLPVVGPDGTIYFVASNGGIFDLNPDGSLKWQDSAVRTSGSFANGPLVVGRDGTVYFGSANPWFYALSADGSSIKWKFNTGTDSFDEYPVLDANGTIYLADGWKLFVINPDGSEKWESGQIVGSSQLFGLPTSAALGADGTLYVGLGGYSLAILAAFRAP
ncbi:MAG TPA: PQQ-binding-like beta-propeller repeat protein [Chloroflexota bacterium]|nr:PQQ-binding-like beta-propeller repeat protein [Chloroflexota bacterium]